MILKKWANKYNYQMFLENMLYISCFINAEGKQQNEHNGWPVLSKSRVAGLSLCIYIDIHTQ